MKKSAKRLLLFFCTAVIIACVFSPCVNTEANSYTQLRQRKITVLKKSKFVSNSLNGVSAIYRKGSNDGSSKTYSCAAYVKKYYKKIYNVKVDNLFYNRTPNAYGDKFIRVKTPQIGDVVGQNTGHGTTHWAIVKQVNDNGTITLIEQNWKWRQGGKTVTVVNRRIKTSKARIYRLKSQFKVKAEFETDKETSMED